MVNTLLLEERIAGSGKTKGYLSEKLGITIQSFKRKCTNVNEFKISEADTLCGELDIKTLREKEAIFFAKNVDKNSTEV